MDPITLGLLGSSALSGISQLGGGLISSGGQAAANSANNLAQQNMNFENQMFMQNQNNQNQTFQNNVNVANWDLQREVNAQNIALQRENRDWASGQADKQMRFQEQMSNSQYQRAMSDMRAAGLNPILAYQQGGAGNLSGAMAHENAPTVGMTGGNASPPGQAFQGRAFTGNQNTSDSLGRGISGMVSSALDAYKTIAGVDQIRQAISESKSRTGYVDAQTATEGIRQGVLKADEAKTKAETENVLAGLPNVKAMLGNINAQTAQALSAAGVNAEQIAIMKNWGARDAPNQPWQRVYRNIEDVIKKLWNHPRFGFDAPPLLGRAPHSNPSYGTGSATSGTGTDDSLVIDIKR